MTKEECNRLNAVFNSLTDFKELFTIGSYLIQPHVMHVSSPVKNQGRRWHEHRTFEFSLLLEGEMRYCFEESGLEIEHRSGDAVLIPAETRHRWELLGDRCVVFGFMLFISCLGEGARLEQEQLRAKLRQLRFRLAGPAGINDIVQRILTAADRDDGYQDERLRSLSTEAFVEFFSAFLPREKRRASVAPPHQQLRGGDPRTLADAVQFYISDNAYRPVTPGEVSRHIGLSLNRINTILRDQCGETVGRMIWTYKLRLACRLLDNTNRQIKDIAAAIGVEDVAYFCRRFRQLQGVSPAEYRQANRR